LPPISQRFSIPGNDDTFELMCRDLLRLYWSRPNLEIFGKRGERQFGIDILDIGGQDPLYAAQCKLKEEHKTLPPSAIEEEVEEAKLFTPPLGKYGILTTAKISTQAQRKIREINQSHRDAGIFEIELLTWEKICELLQRYSEVQEHFYGEIPLRLASKLASKIESGLATISSGVDSLTAKVEGTDIDAQINDARDYVTRREFQIATLLLNRIQQSKGHLLDSYQKFRIASNFGASALGNGKPQEAAKHFLEALFHQPDDERAKTNEVLAYLIVGDNVTAHSKAASLKQKYPTSTRLAAYWIATAPKDVDFHVLESEVPSLLRSDPEISLALARRALTETNLESAELYAGIAAQMASQWSQPQLVIGYINLGRIITANSDRKSSVVSKAVAFVRAGAALSLAIDYAQQEKDIHTQVAGLVARADLALLQKNKEAAEVDARAAYRLNSEDTQSLVALSQIQFNANQINEGISSLDKAYQLDPRADVAFMYGRALFIRGNGIDLETAAKVLCGIDLERVPLSIRPATALQVVQCLIKKKDWPEVTKYIEYGRSHLESGITAMLQGYLAHYEGHTQEAESHALLAQSLLSNDAPVETHEPLALLFMLIGRPADALPIFQKLFVADIPSFDAGNLLNCAALLHRDNVVIETCEQLHERGINDWNLVSFEVPYLEKYHTERAIQRLDSFILENPTHKLAKLCRSIIGVRTNRPQIVASSLSDLPSIEELPAKYAMAAVHVIRFGGNANDAVDYAYRYLRLRFQDMQAHQAFSLSMLPSDPALNIPVQVEEVGPGTAVCYQELPNGDRKWVILENTSQPVSDFEEIAESSFLASQLLGKRVNDEFILAEGFMHTRRAVIHQILSKYVRRYQDCMGEMQIRFGSLSPVESITMGSSDDEMQENLKTILESVKERAFDAEQMRSLYDELFIPLHCYGQRFGKNAYIGLFDLAQDQGHSIKCCLGTVEEYSQATYALQTAQAVVVDLTALATLRILGLERLLSTNRFKFLLSEGTWNELQEMFADPMAAARGGVLEFRDGNHVLHEESVEINRERRLDNEIFCENIRKNCQIIPVLELAAIDPKRREDLEKLFGKYGAESIILASNPDYVLWSDDLVQGQVAANEYGAHRVWTQLVIGNLAESGLLGSQERDTASARLIGMKFVATTFNSYTILEAITLTEGVTWKFPLKQIIEVFANPKGERPLLGIFVDFVAKLYRESFLPETRCGVMQAFLDALWKNPTARAVLVNIRKSSAQLFGLNAVGEKQFNECFDRWTKHRESFIIPVK
jgi:tetratricopeptide (TPR) repeat protein